MQRTTRDYRRLFLILTLAAAVLGALHLLSSNDDGGAVETDTTVGTPEARSFMLACDSLAARPWSAQAERGLQMRLDLAASQGLLSADEHLRLTNYLRSSSAASMQLAFQTWVGGGCGYSPNELEQAMRKAVNWEGCKPIVEPGLRLLDTYRQALGMPDRCTQYTRGPFEQAKDAELRGTIQHLAVAREVAGCSAFSNALVRSRGILDELAAFDKEFREAENVYKKNPNEFSYRMLMVEFCPENNDRIKQYPHYLQQVRDYGLCD
jgi:hypothetical protein